MNYRFARAVKNYVIDNRNKISSNSFADTLKNIYRDYHPENVLVLMNMLDSHDVDRIASQIMNPDTYYDHRVNPAENENYIVEAPDETGIQKLKLIIGLQMTLPGAPAIYYGTEAGMWGGDDPDCRKPMVWPEFDYETETAHPFNKPRKADTVEFNYDIYNWYKKLISIRKSNKLLSTGKIEFYPLTNEVLVYKRFDGKSKIFVAINNQNRRIKFSFNGISELETDLEYNELISGAQIDLNDGHALEPYSLLIFSVN
jgi:glycosidase